VRPPGDRAPQQACELNVLEHHVERVTDPDRQASLRERRPRDLRRHCWTARLDLGHIVIVDYLGVRCTPMAHHDS
jgi:hypothetical protein